MLIRYACRDMGLKCLFEIKGQTMEEVTEQALVHIREKHAQDFNFMETPAQIDQMRQSLARSTRVVVS